MFTKIKNKVTQLMIATYAVLSGFFFRTQQLICQEWTELENTTGFKTMFNNIGRIYIKWAWFFGGVAAVIYFLSRGNEKKAAAAKAVIVGVIIGYIIFAFGGDVIEKIFMSLYNAFGGAS